MLGQNQAKCSHSVEFLSNYNPCFIWLLWSYFISWYPTKFPFKFTGNNFYFDVSWEFVYTVATAFLDRNSIYFTCEINLSAINLCVCSRFVEKLVNRTRIFRYGLGNHLNAESPSTIFCAILPIHKISKCSGELASILTFLKSTCNADTKLQYIICMPYLLLLWLFFIFVYWNI